MEKVAVVLPGRSYDIWIGSGAVKKLRPGRGRSLVVTDSHVDPLWSARLVGQIPEEKFVFTAGEEHKEIGSVMALCSHLAQQHFDRRTQLVALGGGVTGDMTGFSAAIFLRGVEFVQIPTTLLAMVDSSVGGKTAVDIPEGKNLVGAFYQPQQVLIEPEFLATLPVLELRNGLAEVVKTAVIRDAQFFAQLEAWGERLLKPESFTEIYPQLIKRCCEIKADVVSHDETEQGLRAILNYGHTTGHAVELLSNFKIPHGCGVAIGMAVAGRLAEKLGMWSETECLRQRQLLEVLGLPVTVPANLSAAELVEAMHRDKKCVGNHLKFILPHQMGQVEIVSDIPETLVQETLEECYD